MSQLVTMEALDFWTVILEVVGRFTAPTPFLRFPGSIFVVG